MYPSALTAHGGETFIDGGHYIWRLEPDGFACIAQPAGAKHRCIGARVGAASHPELWTALCAMAIGQLAPAAVSIACPLATPRPVAGFSLDGFLDLLAIAGLVDVGSQIATPKLVAVAS